MSEKPESCGICGRKRESQQTGSFTQWISICRCEQIEAPKQASPVCLNCGKFIGKETTGSLTQWVVRPQLCNCAKPASLSNVTGNLLKRRQQSHSPADFMSGLTPENFPLDRYEPVSKLGSGGLGAVYLCSDKKLNKQVAVKVLRMASEEQLVAFQNEAKVTARLKHPNIVSILDFGVTQSVPYMVLEYVEGISLEQLLSERGKLDELTVLSLSTQIASALEHAHALGIFHRDIKSTNILVSGSQNEVIVRVIDFGIAFLEQGSAVVQGRTIVGTPKYMSPDQLLGRRFDARSEVYSMGCLMFEMLSGQVPFDAEDPLALLEKHAKQPVPSFAMVCPDARISSALERVVRTCLEKDPSARFESIQALTAKLASIHNRMGETTILAPLAVANRWNFGRKRSNGFVAGLVTVGILLVGGVCACLYLASNENRPVAPSSKRHVTRTNAVLSAAHESWSVERPRKGAIIWTAARNVTDEDVRDVSPDATGISFNYTSVTERALDLLRAKSLVEIHASYTNLGDSCAERLLRFNKLSYLDVTASRFTKKGLVALAPLKLSTLNISTTAIGDEAMPVIVAQWPGLVTLRLGHTKMSSKGLLHLKELKDLRILDLAGLTISDKVMDIICEKPLLSLDLTGSNVSRAAVPKLCKMKTLRQLWITGLDGWTTEDHARIQESLTSCTVMVPKPEDTEMFVQLMGK